MAVDFNRIFGTSVRFPLKKDAFLLFFAVQLVLSAAGWFVTAYFGADVVTAEGLLVPENLMPFLVYIIPVTILTWLVVTYLTPAYIDNAAQFHKKKEKAITESLDVSRKRFLSMLGLFAIIGLMLVACFGGLIMSIASAPTLLSAEGMATESLVMFAAGGLWFMAGLVVFTVVAFMIYLAPVFCVLEKTNPLESIRKSWKIVGRNKSNTLLFCIILFMIYFVIAFAGGLPETAFYLMTGSAEITGVNAYGFVFMLIRTLVTVYLTMFLLASVTGYYLSIKKGD